MHAFILLHYLTRVHVMICICIAFLFQIYSDHDNTGTDDVHYRELIMDVYIESEDAV